MRNDDNHQNEVCEDLEQEQLLHKWQRLLESQHPLSEKDKEPMIKRMLKQTVNEPVMPQEKPPLYSASGRPMPK